MGSVRLLFFAGAAPVFLSCNTIYFSSAWYVTYFGLAQVRRKTPPSGQFISIAGVHLPYLCFPFGDELPSCVTTGSHGWLEIQSYYEKETTKTRAGASRSFDCAAQNPVGSGRPNIATKYAHPDTPRMLLRPPCVHALRVGSLPTSVSVGTRDVNPTHPHVPHRIPPDPPSPLHPIPQHTTPSSTQPKPAQRVLLVIALYTDNVDRGCVLGFSRDMTPGHKTSLIARLIPCCRRGRPTSSLAG